MKLNGSKILVLGGARQQGIYVVCKLFKQGAIVEVANRGNHPFWFLPNVKTYIIERNDKESCVRAFGGEFYDAIVDMSAYNDIFVKNIFETTITRHYVQVSSNAVYRRLVRNQFEKDYNPQDYNPQDYNLKETHLTTGDFSYQLGKRAAEWYAIQHSQPSVRNTVIRCPYIYGEHDGSGRLKWFVDKAFKHETFEFCYSNFEKFFSMLHESEAANFIVHCLERELCGIYNVATEDPFSVREIIEHLQKIIPITIKYGEKNHCHYNNVPSSYLNTDKAKATGYKFYTHECFFRTLDMYIKHYCVSL